MRLKKLTLQAFGPYPGEHEIDFAQLDSAGVYLIGGPTGAGKSSILDAIVFALYGAIPRQSDKTGVKYSVRSDLADPTTETRVTLEFETHDTLFRIERSPAYERPKRRGPDTTSQAAKGTLLALRDSAWQTVSTSLREIGAEVEQIVGLSREQFQQIIVLAQGKFAEFLHADSVRREEILRKLFNSSRFQDLTDRLHADAAQTQALMADLEQRIAAAAERAHDRASSVDAAYMADLGLDELIAAVDEVTTLLHDEQRSAQQQLEAAQQRLTEAKEVARDVLIRDEHMRQLDELDQQADGVEEARAALARHEQVQDLWPVITAAERSRDERAEAAVGVTDETTSAKELQQQLRTANDEVAVLRTHAETERQLPVLASAAEAAAEKLQTAVDGRAATLAALSALPEQRQQQNELIERLRAQAADLAGAETEVADLTSLQHQASTLESARSASSLAQDAEQSAAEAVSAASETTKAALQQFFDTTSARLAQQLVDGEACSVCGSLEHPSPALASHDGIVGTDEVERAQAAESKARQTHQDAQAEAARHSAEVERLTDALAEVDIEALPKALQEAQQRVEQHAAALAELATAEAELTALDAQRDQLSEAAEQQSGEITALRSSADVARERYESARSSVEAKLDSQEDSLQDKLARLEAQAAKLEQRLAAVQRFDLAVAAERSADESLLSALDAHPAKTEDTARGWHMSTQDAKAARSSIDAFENERSRIKGVLAQPHIENLDSRAAAAGDIETLTQQAASAKEDLALCQQRVAEAKSVLADVRREHSSTVQLRDEIASHGERSIALARLAATLKGHDPNTRKMRLETYVLAAQLEAILEAANLRLAGLTEGRFSLEHFDGKATQGALSGLGVTVRDAHTGLSRSVSSLSGGETFLASLALALGLADVVQQHAGGISLETLFIDEGFGSLDQETLELAMQTLSDLHAAGRTIGVISHVTSMQERLPQLITVVPGPGGEGSSIEVTDPN